jgi:soluble lytic murein transglycosylase-like protein
MRRTGLRAAVLAAALLHAAPAAAGAQVYEELAASVRHSLAAALADRPVPELAFREREDAHKWLFEMSRRLEKRVPDRKQRLELLRTVHFEALRAGLDPQLVLGIIEVESRFRKYAVSRAGAPGDLLLRP